MPKLCSRTSFASSPTTRFAPSSHLARERERERERESQRYMHAHSTEKAELMEYCMVLINIITLFNIMNVINMIHIITWDAVY